MKPLLYRQQYHILIYLALSFIVVYLIGMEEDSDRTFAGMDLYLWTAISWISVGFVQFWIALFWGVYSVFFYFGVNRAMGSDHFRMEVRQKPLEGRGAFRFVPNSMYTLVLLALYHPGLFYESSFGLLLAPLQHMFVWTHYFCTENLTCNTCTALKSNNVQNRKDTRKPFDVLQSLCFLPAIRIKN